ncbi:gastrula zinc finger protein XlCGF7.1-like [Ochlerotatus camptorhynchus]|uniref:gastrula zinc finger protein XlCGF7.1-like n=1 Tax=Ochlerotatus camptorhynchus TaxID=644619 RepID=UPI0031D3FDA2
MSGENLGDEMSEISIDSVAVNEEIETFETHTLVEEEAGASTPVDCQEILIGELFERPPSVVEGHVADSAGFVCNICSKRFDEPRKLVRHVECHSRRRFKCEQCGLFLKSRSSFNSHQQRHRNGKRFQCDVCGKGFAAARDLKNHRKVHDAQAERFRCDECGKDFGRIYSLMDHKRLHSGKEVFSCDKCDKVFPKRRNLLLHERSHLVDEEVS